MTYVKLVIELVKDRTQIRRHALQIHVKLKAKEIILTIVVRSIICVNDCSSKLYFALHLRFTVDQPFIIT